MKTGDRVIVVNEDSGLFGKTGLIVQHPLGRLFPKDKKRIFVKIDGEMVSMGRFEASKTWEN